VHTSAPGSFLDAVMRETPGGEALRTCLQCGTCGGSCPSGPDMDHTPRAIFALVAAGERARVLRSNTPWYAARRRYRSRT
jgi:heterodisulfide reductase subunit C